MISLDDQLADSRREAATIREWVIAQVTPVAVKDEEPKVESNSIKVAFPLLTVAVQCEMVVVPITVYIASN